MMVYYENGTKANSGHKFIYLLKKAVVKSKVSQRTLGLDSLNVKEMWMKIGKMLRSCTFKLKE